MNEAAHPKSWKARLLHELKEYGGTFLYLFIAFAVVVFYRDAVLRAEGIAVSSYGFAFVKALVLAKFMVLGQAARLGEGLGGQRRILRILWRTSLILVLLVGLTMIEEALVGLAHGRGALASIQEMADGSPREKFATVLLLWLILLPFFFIRMIDEALGKGELRRILLGRG